MKVETKEEPITCDLLSRQRTVIMGLAILSVIFFHYTDDCMTYKMYNEGFIKWYWTYVKSSGVDIFLFLSGLSLYYAMKKNSDIVRFYKRRLVRILIPYFLVAVPTWVILDMVLKGEGIKDVVLHLSFLTFFTRGTKLYWYIGMILVCYLIFPAIYAWMQKCSRIVLQWGACILICLLITFVAYELKVLNQDFYKHVEIAVFRLPPFLLGCIYGKASYEKRHGYWLWGLAAVLSASVIAQVLERKSTFFDRYIIAIVNMAMIACLAVLLDKLKKDNWFVRFTSWFGIRSLELYLCHISVRRILNLTGHYTSYVKYEMVMLGVTMAGAWLLHKVTTEIKWNKLQRPVLSQH